MSDAVTQIRDRLIDVGRVIGELAGSGPLHRRRLEGVEHRVAVSGVRGKSTATRCIYEALQRREYDTYAKVTGDRPRSLYDGEVHEIERVGPTRLYENEREVRRYAPFEAMVVENQGIREYTTRLVNESYVHPDVLFLTNVREDHLDTLGTTRWQIARSLARAVPPDTHVVSGEQDTEIQRFLEDELARRDVEVTHVAVPEDDALIPGAEVVHGIDAVLRALGEPPLTIDRRRSLLDDLRVSWTRLPDGRVFDASNRNDVQSTELVRRALLERERQPVQPLIHLRPDRPGRTASFARYFQRLADSDAIAQVRAVVGHEVAFDKHVPVPTVEHDPTADAGAVLDEALADSYPVMVVGNAVTPFVRDLQTVIERRRVGHDSLLADGDGQP